MRKTAEELKTRTFLRAPDSGAAPQGDLTTETQVLKNGAAMGFSVPELSKLLGCSKRTLVARMEGNKFLSQAFQQGSDVATQCIVGRMFQVAMGGQPYTKRKVIHGPKGKTVTTEYLTAPPNPMLLLFWATNRDPEHWKHIKNIKSNATIDNTYELKEADKISKLAGGILSNDSVDPSRKCVVPAGASRVIESRQGDAGSVPGDMPTGHAGSVQDVILDIPAEEGTEPV